jgi:hypothetical protein
MLLFCLEETLKAISIEICAYLPFTKSEGFKRLQKPSLSVIWRANKMSWVMQALLEDRFKGYFSSAVKNYCKQNNVTFKALLVLENTPGHATVLNSLCEKCKSHIFTSEHYIFATANGPGNNFNF